MKNKKGFTLVELLVTMAIIAVILGMTVFGISLAQRASRDAQRRNTVDDIAMAIQSYYELYNQYPESTDIDFQSNKVVLERNGNVFISVELKGIAKQVGFNLGGGDTDANGTRYCYERTSGGYALGAVLENGEWFEEGADVNASCEQLFGRP
ncbi:type II secretion system protein [Candidatus Dojkabacteria bacterium]|nr:type II secretion system protein [Candidatus Dojkabacteria bacterium]